MVNLVIKLGLHQKLLMHTVTYTCRKLLTLFRAFLMNLTFQLLSIPIQLQQSRMSNKLKIGLWT